MAVVHAWVQRLSGGSPPHNVQCFMSEFAMMPMVTDRNPKCLSCGAPPGPAPPAVPPAAPGTAAALPPADVPRPPTDDHAKPHD